jgi:predicted N-acetyltransferase YhbS
MGIALEGHAAMVTIRQENPSDAAAREALLDEAFGAGRFAKTAERLRQGRAPANGLSFVARAGERLVGTVRLWNIAAGPDRPALLLGPLAVARDVRGRGIGRHLMRHALDSAGRCGHAAVLLVGDAPYYGRFGFSSEATGALGLPGPYERARLLALELKPGALEGAHGLIRASGARVRNPVPAARTLPNDSVLASHAA